jgi:regulator of sigma E protease
MEFLIKASQLIMSLSILVVLHELGHFIPAKLFKTRVEKFYLFFDPWFSLVKKKIGDTEYGIGWLPLGGYVKRILGVPGKTYLAKIDYYVGGRYC